MQLLDARNLGISFGGIQALKDFNISMQQGELVGLIGPNGAGKTTVFNLISGVYSPTHGTLLFNGGSIAGMKPYKISALGIARTFQNIRLFKNLTVLENVRIAHHPYAEHSIYDSFLHTPKYAKGEDRITSSTMEFLKTFDLQNKAREIARNLSYGEQRKLEIARALATRPKLLLLDEPAAGMNPQETNNLMDLIEFIREDFHLTILLIEHQMRVIMSICMRILVLDFGEVICEGSPTDIQQNQRVIEAYLGRQASKNVAKHT
jgi:branched-chain amino acid transport system ATP-binding protein